MSSHTSTFVGTFLVVTLVSCVANRAPPGARTPTQDRPAATAEPSVAASSEVGSLEHAIPEEAAPDTRAIGSNVQSEPQATKPHAPSRRRCVGTQPPKDRPHSAACCYPSRERLLAPLRALNPAFRACYDARRAPAMTGTMHVTFRIERDGHVLEACAEPSGTLDDADGAVTLCVLGAVTTATYAATSESDEAVCGLIRLTYPIQFVP